MPSVSLKSIDMTMFLLQSAKFMTITLFALAIIKLQLNNTTSVKDFSLDRHPLPVSA